MNLLQNLQNLSLEEKINLTQEKIKEWYDYWNGDVYISFSGGKDSTVLLLLAREIYPEIKAVFINTGLEWPEIKKWVKIQKNIEWIHPKIKFPIIIEKYGYPVISKVISQQISEIRTTKSKKLLTKRLHGIDNKKVGKLSEKWKYLINAPFKISHRCCYYLKKQPVIDWEKENKCHPILGVRASESNLRQNMFNKNGGCNTFKTKRPISMPLSFWKNEDIDNFLNQIDYTPKSIYKKGMSSTGCMFCLFGIHTEKSGIFYKNRFQIMKELHIDKYNYCMENLKIKEVLQFLKISY